LSDELDFLEVVEVEALLRRSSGPHAAAVVHPENQFLSSPKVQTSPFNQLFLLGYSKHIEFCIFL